VLRLDDDADPLRAGRVQYGVGDLVREPLLDLKATLHATSDQLVRAT